MNKRLKDIIEYKTGGKQTAFADLLGWSPQYLTKLLKGGNFGIRPVTAILTTFKDVNARWFILGEGEMIEGSKFLDIRRKLLENMLKILDVEKFAHVMSPDELRSFEEIIIGYKISNLSDEMLNKWRRLEQERESTLAESPDVLTKPKKVCKQRKAKK